MHNKSATVSSKTKQTDFVEDNITRGYGSASYGGVFVGEEASRAEHTNEVLGI